jgi:hypothetical protein
MADNLPPSSADVTESGNLNLPEPSGTHRPVMELLYFTVCHIIRNSTCKQMAIEHSNFVYQNNYVFRTLEIINRLALER